MPVVELRLGLPGLISLLEINADATQINLLAACLIETNCTCFINLGEGGGVQVGDLWSVILNRFHCFQSLLNQLLCFHKNIVLRIRRGSLCVTGFIFLVKEA